MVRDSKIDKMKKRMQLMDSLVKTGVLYEVEIWGWKRREEMEKLQGRYIKLKLGVAKKTQGYI